MDLPLKGFQTFTLSVVVLRDYEMTGAGLVGARVAGFSGTAKVRSKLRHLPWIDAGSSPNSFSCNALLMMRLLFKLIVQKQESQTDIGQTFGKRVDI
ncbi:MAG: hypothetical protein HF981_19500 [Desulfobacteraceae bacterium]|nr:hypothetical protein [Desulfobacteraceae bacterium]MBC2752587.1 hypothetical protein [Desulfobacteraceae bacterium]